MQNFWVEQEELLIKEHYLKKDGIKTLMSLLPHRGYNAIKGHANWLGLKRKIPRTKDETFFSEPNVINSHIAGLLASDGCIDTFCPIKKHRISIGLQPKDIKTIEYIKRITKSTTNILHRKGHRFIAPNGRVSNSTGCNTLYFTNAENWKNDLERHWSITSRKSLTLQPPKIDNYGENVILGFLQGVIEGDGSIQLLKLSSSEFCYSLSLTINIVGTYDLLSWIRSRINLITGIDSLPKIYKKKDSKAFEYNITGKRAEIIGRKILKLNTEKMERKWDKVKFYILLRDKLQNISIKKEKQEIFTQEVVSFYNEYEQKFGKKLNIIRGLPQFKQKDQYQPPIFLPFV